MPEILILASVLSPIILGLVELSKRSFKYPVNFVPLVAVIIGLFVGFAATPFTELELTLRLWSGLLAGLAATGLFELFSTRKGTTEGDGK